jgi:hypothetical protein
MKVDEDSREECRIVLSTRLRRAAAATEGLPYVLTIVPRPASLRHKMLVGPKFQMRVGPKLKSGLLIVL